MAASTVERPQSSTQSHLSAVLDQLQKNGRAAGMPSAPGLAPLVAWHLRNRGEPLPAHLEDIARRSAYGTVTAAPLLERVRAAVDGPLLILKGPEIAARYPQPALRPYGDLDLLVEDLERAESQLVAAGFELLGEGAHRDLDHHHDRPIRLKGTALAIELHRDPGWLPWMTAPTNAEIFALSVPTVTGVEGVLTLPPAEHAIYLAAHAWRHTPANSLLHLIDIDLIRRESAPAELENLAAAWGAQHIWRHTLRFIDYFLYGKGSLSPIERFWSRHLPKDRPRHYWEFYIAHRTRGLAAPRGEKLRAVTTDTLATFALRPGESRTSVAKHIWYRLTHPGQPWSPRKRQ